MLKRVRSRGARNFSSAKADSRASADDSTWAGVFDGRHEEHAGRLNEGHSQSESGSAEGSAAVGESPTGAGPTVVGQSPAEVGPTAVRETIVRDSGSRNFGATGRGETAVSVEVGPERDQSDQRGRAG